MQIICERCRLVSLSDVEMTEGTNALQQTLALRPSYESEELTFTYSHILLSAG